MAVIGEMQQLTINGKTYTLPSGGGGSVSSVTVSNATNGGLSVSGSPITSSGTITIGHSNVLSSAQTTQAVYPIKIDKNGHISEYGSAVSIPVNRVISVAEGQSAGNIRVGTVGNDGTASYTDVPVKGLKIVATSGSYNDLTNKPTIPTVPTNVSAFTNDAGYITSADVPEGASAYTGTISAVSTTASNGTNNGFARGDHVHNITGTTITSALGYTPYNSTNPNGYISSYTDEQMKWTASISSNTYYPLQSTSTATTSTANTLNGISFYQYYNTAGGYRRLDLGNTTAYKSSGGAYGTIRLYGAAATYYGDLVPGVLGTTSGDGHISANRTWTLPDKTGTIALTSDIPTVSYPVTSVNSKTGAVSLTASDVGALASNTTYVSTITTTAGTHTAISSKSDAAEALKTGSVSV